MKKLCRKSTVHPTTTSDDDGDLSFLPASVLVLAEALSGDDRRVLAYLLRRRPTRRHDQSHAPLHTCGCFACYTSYWARWDSSPNRHLIGDVIDAVEASPAQITKARKNRPSKTRPNKTRPGPDTKPAEDPPGEAQVADVSDGGGDVTDGAVRKMVSFIGEKIWGVWG